LPERCKSGRIFEKNHKKTITWLNPGGAADRPAVNHIDYYAYPRALVYKILMGKIAGHTATSAGMAGRK
jgi:hypothetical protein